MLDSFKMQTRYYEYRECQHMDNALSRTRRWDKPVFKWGMAELIVSGALCKIENKYRCYYIMDSIQSEYESKTEECFI